MAERKCTSYVRIRDGDTYAKGDKVTVKRTQNGGRHISVSSTLPRLNPHSKPDTTEKRHTNHGHHRTDPSSKPSSVNPHTQDTQPKRRPEVPPPTPPFQNDGPTAPSPRTRALTLYTASFPNSHTTIPTPSSNLLCGLAATTLTMRAMHPTLPTPTTTSLLAVFNSPENARRASGFNLTNENNFHVDQIGLVLFLWGRGRGLDLQVGYVSEGRAPQLVPHPEGEGRVVVWIFHVEADREGGVGHFEGMRPKGSGEVRESGRVREFGKGVQRRGWVKRLDGKLSSMAESVFGALEGSSESSSDSSG